MVDQAVIPDQNSSYAAQEITKPPNWHTLVTFDMLFNNLSTGLFLVAAVGELMQPAVLGPVSRLAYPLALGLLLADLLCLVLDLGDPLRFHHMLRVFKPLSPMSLGTWSLTCFSMPLSLVVGLDVLSWLGLVSRLGAVAGTIRMIALVVGLVPALASAVYKGVLFSTSAQPGWKDARWLGGYLTSSAVMLGCAEMLVLARLGQQSKAASSLLPVFAAVLMINLLAFVLLSVELLPALKRVTSRGRLMGEALLVVLGGFALPLGLAYAGTGVLMIGFGVALLLLANLFIRHRVVMLPHQVHEA